MRRMLGLYAAAAFLFLHLPLLTLAAFSFNRSRFTVWQGFSHTWYSAMWADVQLAQAAWNSIVIAAAATVLSTVAGTLAAYALWKRDAPWLSRSLYASL